ncbi:MAG TPA: reductive dehalogenase domain-containing protein, partial [Candidatus Krumholzibacterium sp.]|nr:reductive dehalogenase domain-containing protein [Candidatus Krumholzibacterium sp.]
MTVGRARETEGEIARFDERDTVFSREALVYGSPDELDYHAAHPELLEVDRKLARFIVSKMEGGGDTDRLARAIYESHFMTSAALALPDQVDGTPAPDRMELSPEEAAGRIKRFAAAIGADDVRIGPLRQEWVYSHRGSRPFFREGFRNEPYYKGIPDGYQGRAYGESIRLDHPNAVSLAFAQDRELIAGGSTRGVDFEVGRVYAKSVIASVQLARFIRALGYPARAHHLRNYLILCVPVAVDSGIGELARCGYVVSRRLGANFRLSAVTTTLPLKHDYPVDIGMQDFCDKCRKCAINCPSGAIPHGKKALVNGSWRWKLNAEA